MNNNDIIKLVSETITIDSYGDQVITETKKEVYAQVKSVGMSEFYQAHGVGLKPEIKFVLSDYYDYNEEPRVEYGSDVYTVVRTYRNDKSLEIVCRKGIDR